MEIDNYITEQLEQKDQALWSYLKRHNLLKGKELRKFARSIDADLEKSIDADGNWTVNGEGQFDREYVPKDKLKEYLKNSQLGKDAITIDFVQYLIRQFGKAQKLEILREYIMKGYSKGESFNCAEIGCVNLEGVFNRKNIFDFTPDWKTVAEQIAKETNVKNTTGSSAIGAFELLFKFIIKGTKGRGKGDVIVDGKGIEIKASKGSGAVMKTRKSDAGYKNFYNKLSEKLGGDIKCKDCFKAKKDIEGFLKKIRSKKLKQDVVYEAMVYASAELYGVKDEDISALLNHQIKKSDFLKNADTLLSVLGWIQLNLYQMKDEFDYIVVFDDKGNYNWLKIEREIPFEFTAVSERFLFKPMSDSGSCRIYYKNNQS